MEFNPLQRRQKLRKIAAAEGFSTVTEMLEHAIMDAVSPGICSECDFICSSIEPDAQEGWCENCDKNTVIAAPVLAGII
jgi:hypothetical protein